MHHLAARRGTRRSRYAALHALAVASTVAASSAAHASDQWNRSGFSLDHTWYGEGKSGPLISPLGQGSVITVPDDYNMPADRCALVPVRTAQGGTVWEHPAGCLVTQPTIRFEEK